MTKTSTLVSKGQKLIEKGIEKNYQSFKKHLIKACQKENAQDIAYNAHHDLHLQLNSKGASFVHDVFLAHLFTRDEYISFLCHAMINTVSRLDDQYLDSDDPEDYDIYGTRRNKVKKLLNELQECHDYLKKVGQLPSETCFFSKYSEPQLGEATNIKTVKQVYKVTDKDITYLVNLSLKELSQVKKEYFAY